MEGQQASQYQKQWLLPFNRRLRHLHGLSLRNLLLIDRPKPGGAHSLDDEALPFSYASPSKTLVSHEQQTLEYSRSSSDLRAISESLQPSGIRGEYRPTGAPNTTPSRVRPLGSRLRRRSTLEWVNASPRAKQKKMEDLADCRMADVFFSLHVVGMTQPIYVSEVAARTMNPTFRHFDLHSCGPNVTRQHKLIVRIWARREKDEQFFFLVESTLLLNDLNFVGKSLQNFHHPLPANCIILHLTDGMYARVDDLSASTYHGPPLGGRPLTGRVLPTAMYDALMRLSTLDDCIQDALQTRSQLERQINDILMEHRGVSAARREVAIVRESWLNVENSIAQQKRHNDAIKVKRDRFQHQLKVRKELMSTSKQFRDELLLRFREDSLALPGIRASLASLGEDLEGQRRRVCEDLVKIFPIEPVPNRALYFTIRGVYLPNSDFEGERDLDEDNVAAALGWVAQITHHLSFYLSIPLPYPLTPLCSTSMVSDPISTTPSPAAGSSTSTSRVYPLFMKAVPRFRFEYGVFLLNKNIEVLSNGLGLRVMDLRQTLPNLKYLLYVATAGKGEMPVRRSGGIRGLIHGIRLRPTSLLSRSDSLESIGTSLSITTHTANKASTQLRKVDPVAPGNSNSLQKAHDTSTGSQVRSGGQNIDVPNGNGVHGETHKPVALEGTIGS